MIQLYEKPVYYSDFVNKPLDADTVLQNKDKLISICAYKAQSFINRQYGFGYLSDDELKDMVQEASIRLIRDIDKYAEHTSVNFWAYVSECIRHESSRAYGMLKEQLGASAYSVTEARKVLELMHDNNWGINEAAENLKMRKSTIKKYVRIGKRVEILDAENDDGFALYSKLSDERTPDVMFDEKPEDEVDDTDLDIETLICRMFPELDMTAEEMFVVTVYIKNKIANHTKSKTISECGERGIAAITVNKTINRFLEYTRGFEEQLSAVCTTPSN